MVDAKEFANAQGTQFIKNVSCLLDIEFEGSFKNSETCRLPFRIVKKTKKIKNVGNILQNSSMYGLA